jgi:uncharacterized protein
MLNIKQNRKYSRRFLLGYMLVASVLCVSVISSPAWADQLDELRASGAVGEAFDGYARARDSSANGFVTELNDKRRDIYIKRAKSDGVGVEQVGRVYAAQIIQKVPAGTWILSENGKWTQK